MCAFWLIGVALVSGCSGGAVHLPTLASLPKSTDTPTPSPTHTPTRTPHPTQIVVTPAVVRLPTFTPTPPRPPTLNGLPLETLIVLSSETRAHMREVYARGQRLGRDPHAFSKLGDSTIENPHFLDRFDGEDYNLGAYAYLEPTIAHYQGSFARRSAAVRRGLHAWSVFDPGWAADPACLPNEHVLDCELRVHNPSMIFIRLGTNDRGVPESFDQSLQQVVAHCLENGVIPLLGTKADRRDGAHNINNTIIRKVAEAYQVPLWDFDLAAETLPGRGLTVDNVHMTTFYAHDYTLPAAFQSGYGVHNLLALLVLDDIRREVMNEGGR
ncbi:MAG: hypothetical protein OHK0046_42420 [Anaerolineae bacterium]